MKTVGSRPLAIADEREASRWVREMFGRVAGFTCDPRTLRAVLRHDVRTMF